VEPLVQRYMAGRPLETSGAHPLFPGVVLLDKLVANTIIQL